MIAPELVQRVERLLAEGRLSQRNIAKLTGVSRGSVGAIAAGRRPDYEALRRRRQEQEPPKRTGPPQRCPDCGAMVLMPCLACELKRDARGAPGRRPGPRSGYPDGLLELDLRGEHRARYERVRARREAEAEQAAHCDEPHEANGRAGKVPRLSPRQLRDALEYDDGPLDDDLTQDVPLM
jgi:hypothetical protein